MKKSTFTVEEINEAITKIDVASESPPKKGYQSFSNSYERRLKSYQPSDGQGNKKSSGVYHKDYYTWCNYAVQDILHYLGLDPDKDYPRTDMNCGAMMSFFDKSNLWKEIDAIQAQKNANNGIITVGSTSSHIVLIRAEGNQYKMKDNKYPVCAQAGSKPREWGYFEASGIRYWSFMPYEQDKTPNDINVLTKTLTSIYSDRYINSNETPMYSNIDLLSGNPLSKITTLSKSTKVYTYDKLVFSNGASWAYCRTSDNFIGFVDPNKMSVERPIVDIIQVNDKPLQSNLKDYFTNFIPLKNHGTIVSNKYGSPIDGTAIGMLSKGGGSSSEYYIDIINQTYEYMGEGLWNSYHILPSLALIIGIMESSLIPYSGYRLNESNKISSQIESSYNIMGMIHRKKSSGGADLTYLEKPTLVRLLDNSQQKYLSQVYAFNSINECIGYFGYLLNSSTYNNGANIINRYDTYNIFNEFVPKYLGSSKEESDKFIDTCKKFYSLTKYAFHERDNILCNKLGVM